MQNTAGSPAITEEQIIAAIGRLKCARKNLIRGDDIGAFKTHGTLYAATDSLIEGIHYLNVWLKPKDIAYKLFARNFSDFAVKNIRPQFALLNLGLSKGHANRSFVKAFLHELDGLMTRFGITLVGGDTGSSPQDHFTLSLMGSSGSFVPRKAVKLTPGDWVFQLGPVGGSDAVRLKLEQANLSAKAIRPFSRPDFLHSYPKGFRPVAAIDQSDSVEKTLRLLAEANSAELEINLETLATAREVGPVTDRNAQQVLSAAEDLAVFGIVSGGGRVPAESPLAFRRIGEVKYIHRARARVSYYLHGRPVANRTTSFEHFG